MLGPRIGEDVRIIKIKSLYLLTTLYILCANIYKEWKIDLDANIHAAMPEVLYN